jgi:phospholipase C
MKKHSLSTQALGLSKQSCASNIASLCASLLIVTAWPGSVVAADQHGGKKDRTPIQHVIVVVGENHTFDNVFGGYAPQAGQSVWNLLSEGIINPDGSPGINFWRATQNQATDTGVYSVTPSTLGPYAAVDQPNTTYAFGLPGNVPDPRFPASLPNGPFQISKYVPYEGTFTGDPVHRFFQMWQQYDGGRLDLFQWVAETVGIGPQNGAPAPTPGVTGQGGVAMGFLI